MQKSKDLKPAKLAIDKISQIDNEADLSAFVDGEDRVTVTAAADARYAELVSATDEDEAAGEDAAPAEQPSEDEVTTAADTEEQTEEVEVILLADSDYASIVLLVGEKIDQEKERFSNKQLPAGDVAAVLNEAVEAIKASAEGDEQIEIPAPVYDAFMSALQNQITIDRSNRGLTQPGKVDAELIAVFEALTAEE
jgi:hypothetical protein